MLRQWRSKMRVCQRKYRRKIEGNHICLMASCNFKMTMEHSCHITITRKEATYYISNNIYIYHIYGVFNILMEHNNANMGEVEKVSECN